MFPKGLLGSLLSFAFPFWQVQMQWSASPLKTGGVSEKLYCRKRWWLKGFICMRESNSGWAEVLRLILHHIHIDWTISFSPMDLFGNGTRKCIQVLAYTSTLCSCHEEKCSHEFCQIFAKFDTALVHKSLWKAVWIFFYSPKRSWSTAYFSELSVNLCLELATRVFNAVCQASVKTLSGVPHYNLQLFRLYTEQFFCVCFFHNKAKLSLYQAAFTRHQSKPRRGCIKRTVANTVDLSTGVREWICLTVQDV